VNQWHVGVAAEAFAAGILARCGFDVSVQYGANQPEYDLIVVKERIPIKVSVKGSQDGGWGLTQSYIKEANYHAAADAWLKKHDTRTLFCLVQFKGVSINQMPRIYLAWPEQIAAHLKKVAKGRGETILFEYKEWTSRAFAAGTIDKIPDEWAFSEERLAQVLVEARI
jgi:Holliday junction resolvase-like predicted endonuclease